MSQPVTLSPAAGRYRYPVAPRQDLVEERHGLRIADPYRWLEDPASPQSAEWSTAQETLFAAERSRWRGTGHWRERLTALAGREQTSAPLCRGRRLFFLRRPAGAEHPVLLVREDGVERPLLDPAAIDPSGGTTLERVTPSLEGHLVACQLSAAGVEDTVLRVLDAATGETVDGPAGRLRRSPVAWLPGGQAFYYVRRLPPGLHPGEERYHRRVYLHRLGTDPDDDVLVFGEGRPKTQFYAVSLTPDGRWLAITATDGTDPATDVWLADLESSSPHRPALRHVDQQPPGRTWLRIAPGTGPRDPMWLFTTSGAARGRIVTASPAAPGPQSWRELIPQRPDAVLTDFAVLTGPGPAACGGPLGLAAWTRHAVAEITVHRLADGAQVGTVPLPGDGRIGPLSVPPHERHLAWFSYTDHVTDQVVLCFDGRTGQVSRWPLAGPSGGHGETTRRAGPAARVSRGQCTSRDGTVVRTFVISPAGRPDRPRPAILTGYGGFGVSMSPSYTPDALAWVQAGGVFAVACLRGGGEEGGDWHQAGRGTRKQNVFDDFDAVSDALVAQGWTTPGQLGIMGGSNGGLLMGAALTQHPEKYGAVVCIAPLLDMARYELSGLGPSWRPEYGTADDPQQLRNLLAYSPYHHVTEGTRYPPVLFAVFDGDTRTDPLHARKMCAALQQAGPQQTVLLRLERGTGHGRRAASRERALQADCLSFFGHHLVLPGAGAES
jgi:prolyl oligopeptidase